MQYKAIPGPKMIRIENDDLTMATNSFADIINANAINGWKFYSLETIKTVETKKAGCFLNKKVWNEYNDIYMLIFARED